MASKIGTLKAFTLGVRDGWAQPHDLLTSYNIEHLTGDEDDLLVEAQDRGINLGQFARAGFRSQSWRLHYWPFNRFRGEV